MPSQLAPQTGETESQPVSAWALQPTLPAPPSPDVLTSTHPSYNTPPALPFSTVCWVEVWDGQKTPGCDLTQSDQTQEKLQKCSGSIRMKAELCNAKCLPSTRYLIIVTTLKTAPSSPRDARRRGREVLWSEGRERPWALGCQRGPGRTVGYRAPTMFSL